MCAFGFKCAFLTFHVRTESPPLTKYNSVVPTDRPDSFVVIADYAMQTKKRTDWYHSIMFLLCLHYTVLVPSAIFCTTQSTEPSGFCSLGRCLYTLLKPLCTITVDPRYLSCVSNWKLFFPHNAAFLLRRYSFSFLCLLKSFCWFLAAIGFDRPIGPIG